LIINDLTSESSDVIRVSYVGASKIIMKEWLAGQKKIEHSLIEAVGIQSRQIADELVPQVRLCALENEMTADIFIKVHFEFNGEKTEVWSEGAVQFPAKQSVSALFELSDNVEDSGEAGTDS
jgi:hypothetical protein